MWTRPRCPSAESNAGDNPQVPAFLCPVRGCGEPLVRGGRALSCPRGHGFDVARSGYVNLLQPQDRRSLQAGDSKAMALARRRLYEAGYGTPLLAAIVGAPEVQALLSGAAVLDVGCGEGWMLGFLAARRPIEGHGVDLSAPAIELAARRYPALTWVVANADRSLPYTPAGFDLALSITARRNAPELARVLTPGSSLLVAVPAADDLVELREAVQGEGVLRDRTEGVVEELASAFDLARRETVRSRAVLDSAALRDLLSATYRGARRREQERAAALSRLEVTTSWDLLWLSRRPG